MTQHRGSKTHLIIGRVGAPFGVKGWLRIQSYSEFDASILDYQPWFITTEADAQTLAPDASPLEIEDSATQAKGIIIKIKGIATPEAARSYTGKYILVSWQKIPPLPPKEYYWSDLKGLTVIDQAGKVLGIVIYLLETGANDVLVVKGDKEHAIPYLYGTVIQSVDLDKQEIHVHWDLI